MLRNQVIHLITYGHLVSTKAVLKKYEDLLKNWLPLLAKAIILMLVVVHYALFLIRKKLLLNCLKKLLLVMLTVQEDIHV